jgi:hypothetical protein
MLNKELFFVIDDCANRTARALARDSSPLKIWCGRLDLNQHGISPKGF